MRTVDDNEYAILALSTLTPPSFLPPFHLAIAERLSQRGLLTRERDHWCPTSQGLEILKAASRHLN
jgi:hypothetical protein